jgi:hypothetical protein
MLINHCWCSDSNWGGHYNCRVIVTIDRIHEGKTYYDPPTVDWTNLIKKVDLEWKKFGDAHATYRLKQEVIDWLAVNIPIRNGEKGWAIGTDQYNTNAAISFSLFFQSARDAQRFIKRWSSLGKPADKLNYFLDKRYKYNPKTKTLQRAPR